MDINESPSMTRDSKLVSQTDLHSLRSGVGGYHLGSSKSSACLTHLQRARPVAPPGQGCTVLSLMRVQFQYKFRICVGGQ